MTELCSAETPLIMGIVNVTPDSFSDGGLFFDPQSAVDHALKLKQEGADILDIGGQSTRPGYTRVPDKEELNRIEPVITELKKNVSVPISVDTFFPSVAERALSLGASIINDVSGKITPEMAECVVRYGAYWVVTDNKPLKPGNCMTELEDNLKAMTEKAAEYGVSREKIIFDPGFGFGKTREQDIFILKNISVLSAKMKILAGMSRKRMIAVLSGEDEPLMRDNASAVAAVYAALSGVSIIRTHNVRLTREAYSVLGGILGVGEPTNG